MHFSQIEKNKTKQSKQQKQQKQQKQKKKRNGKMILPTLNLECIEPRRRISSDRYTDRQTYRQTYRQTHRQTDVQTDIYQTLLLSIIDIGLLNYHIIIYNTKAKLKVELFGQMLFATI